MITAVIVATHAVSRRRSLDGHEHGRNDRGGERTHRKDREALAVERPNLVGLDGGSRSP
jgi:hypothetical protein